MKACINIISSRQKCIPHCLKSLWEGYNSKHEYPVYVYYFDEIYESEKFQDTVRKLISPNIFFKQIPYNTPKFLKEEDLYYNRKDLWYVKGNFSIHRKGYLHMCHFTSNMYGYENTELEKYDFIMTHDDESGYDKDLEKDPFQQLKDAGVLFGAFKTGKRLRNGKPHQGHLDTRIGLWKLTREFIVENNLTPKNEELAALMTDPEAETNFHYLDWCDTYVIDTKMFKMPLWQKWIGKINESGGIYKYRWGDNEVYSLFANMIQEKIYDFNLVDSGVHNQGKFRGLQDIAPGVKDLKR